MIKIDQNNKSIQVKSREVKLDHIKSNQLKRDKPILFLTISVPFGNAGKRTKWPGTWD